MENVGKIACSDLQKEFSKEDVKFLKADVTNSEQLVRFSGKPFLPQ